MTHRTLTLGCLVVLGCLAGCGPAQKPSTQPAPQTNNTTVAPSPATKIPSLRMLAWNIESDGNSPTVIAEQLEAFQDYDLIALSEVNATNAAKYSEALGADFDSVMTDSGDKDRLLTFYRRERFDVQEKYEMDELNDGYHRSPLRLQLLEKETGFTFVVVSVHLARGSETLRKTQAEGLRDWAETQTLPVFAIGDFNFDYNYIEKAGNEAFVAFLQKDVWDWIEPEENVDTNWADRDEDGKDNYPDSMLDFTFVAHQPPSMTCRSRVIEREGDFPDDETTSDHRPLELVIDHAGQN